MNARAAVLSLALLLVLPAAAHVVEEQFDLPVTVRDRFGKEVSQPIKVTLWRDDANPAPAPVVVINHGRAPDAQGRAQLGRARYSDASRWFMARGFIVAVPTRIGYGVTGGEDVEDSGSCGARNFPPAFEAAGRQVLAVLDTVRQRPDAAKDRAVIAGVSVGGATSIATLSLQPAGVQGAVNFSGGSGGDPKGRPMQPCSTPLMERAYGGWGSRSAGVPTLWLYAENDQYFGPKYPREWFEAFRAAGGRGDFVLYPPQGEDGHALFTRFPAVWQPRVGEFLDTLGYPVIERKKASP